MSPANRLHTEKSPYLLQHAGNPVDWFPWGEEAFARARADEKPIFLSVGYSTCYWCHVMEREVFENEKIASLMNEKFVNVKVDREERPDVDRVYMTALQAMTGSGGWPMSMFLTHDLKPFYGVTYVPPVAMHGRPGFPDLLERIHEAWTTRREEIEEAGKRIRDHLRESIQIPASAGLPEAGTLRDGYDAFLRMYDATRGGFGGAPKFPRPAVLSFLFRYAVRSGESRPLEMALHTLRAMYAGGMYDHVGGGFHRYSTDAEWHLPHFEKMLYDQAQLVHSFLEAYQITREPEYAAAARDTLAYVGENLLSPEGGFFSAEDAESVVEKETGRKKEGAYHVWSKDEIDLLLPEKELRIFCEAYDVRAGGNVAHDPHAEFAGLNVLRRVRSVADLSGTFGNSAEDIQTSLDRSLGILKTARAARQRPHRDDKVLAAWNGMMISACAKASRFLDDEPYLGMAKRAADFVLGTMVESDRGVLYRRYREGEAKFHGGLDDYAWTIRSMLDLYELTFAQAYLDRGRELTDAAIRIFDDTERGGFFDTPADDGLIARMKEAYDGAEPSGNAIMAENLLRLSGMTHDETYRRRAEQTLVSFAEIMKQAPHAVPQMLVGLDAFIGPSTQVVFKGDLGSPILRDMIRAAGSRFLPGMVMIHVPERGETGRDIAPDFLRSLPESGGSPVAYVCEDFACQLPAKSVDELEETLDGLSART